VPHPGETEPSVYDRGQRFMCPLCDWYHDEPDPDPFVRFDQPVEWPAGARTLDEAVRVLADARRDRIEAAVVEHMTSVHTAPVVLSERGD